MEIKELEQLRNRPQKITNILKEDFEYKWNGVEYTIAKWETVEHPFYLAERAAFHMARKHCTDNGKKFNREVGKIMDEIMNKKFIEYDLLKMKEVKDLCDERKIKLEDEDWKPKKKAQLIQDLKNTH